MSVLDLQTLPTMEWIISKLGNDSDQSYLGGYNMFVWWYFETTQFDVNDILGVANRVDFIGKCWSNLSDSIKDKWRQLMHDYKNKIGKAFYRKMSQDIQDQIHSAYIEKECRPGGKLYDMARADFLLNTQMT